MPSVAILISTYNWPGALRLCVEGVSQQSIQPAEIIICDDGSTSETKKLIESLREKISIPIKHIWQPDDGFRVAKVRNKGIASTQCDYIVQIDGDILMHRDFIKDHLNLCKNNCFITGSRVLLSKNVTNALLQNKIGGNDLYRSFSNKNILNRVRIPLIQKVFANYYKIRGKNRYYVKGCNMSFWRTDLIKVNGYDESFFGWGLEDNDIAIRLMNAGVKKRFLKLGGVCYHLNHDLVSREHERENQIKLNKVIEENLVKAKIGLDQYNETM